MEYYQCYNVFFRQILGSYVGILAKLFRSLRGILAAILQRFVYTTAFYSINTRYTLLIFHKNISNTFRSNTDNTSRNPVKSLLKFVSQLHINLRVFMTRTSPKSISNAIFTLSGDGQLALCMCPIIFLFESRPHLIFINFKYIPCN